jgi:hypothetical protein
MKRVRDPSPAPAFHKHSLYLDLFESASVLVIPVAGAEYPTLTPAFQNVRHVTVALALNDELALIPYILLAVIPPVSRLVNITRAGEPVI